MDGLYLLHYYQSIPHGSQAETQHYLGWSVDIDRRVKQHRHGNGARLPQVFASRGIQFCVARIWPGADRIEERRIKNFGGLRRVCPVCQSLTSKRQRARDIQILKNGV